MQRIINDPSMVVEDMLKGFEKCHKDIIHVDSENPRVVISNSAKDKKKVGIVTGGGSGHKPAFIGYCGKNMVDAVAVGEAQAVFQGECQHATAWQPVETRDQRARDGGRAA